MNFSPYRLLENSFIYNLSQWILAPGAGVFLKKHFRLIFSESKGLVLDVGCGPFLNTPATGKICGLDSNFGYLKQYIRQSGARGVAGLAESLPFRSNIFDEVRCFGLLHHLSDAAALKAIQEMFRCVRPHGRVVIVDNVWPKNPFLRPLAWLNRRLDRGRWVRFEEKLFDLVKQSGETEWTRYRFTYTLIGHEALALTAKKE